MSDPMTRLNTALEGRYHIERELGEGGMATVYLADDLKHDRKVAIKVLRPELGAVLGAERFLTEIKISARLDHPHILTLIDSGASDGILYYVLPFVRGESLRDKLDREKQLGLDEALAITKQVASALDYAHRQGLVHRDIKPENILIQEGEAMLADFGIALAVTQAGGGRLTETGLSLGTPQYMSPEQATGDPTLDVRSDVYSLGAVLYEMLAGEPPVTGPNAQAMIAKLMTERPTGLRVVRDTVPIGVEAAVAKALSKVPADRFPSAGEFASTLEASRVAAAPRARQSRRPIAVAAGILIVGLGAFGAWRLTHAEDPVPTFGRSEQLTSDPGLEIQPAISPDGKLVAYSAGNSRRMRIFIRPVGGGRAIPLSDDSTAVETQARWSPDGNTLLFLTRGGASVAPALGGSSRPVVAPSGGNDVATAAWSPDGKGIAFSRGDTLFAMAAGDGAARVVALGVDLHNCSWSPDGHWIACARGNGFATAPGADFGNLAPSAIVLVRAAGGTPSELMPPTFSHESPVWAPDGRRLFFLSNRDGPRDIYVAVVSSSGTMRGAPVRLTTGLGAISISLTADGRHLAYAAYTARANIWTMPIPTGGVTESAETAAAVTTGSQIIESIRVSQDGKWLLYDSNLRGNSDIYRISTAGGQPEQLTNDPTDEFTPDLSPDGRSIAYHSWRSGTRDIEVKPLDGGAVVRVTDTPAQEGAPVWSPDGQALVFYDLLAPSTLLIARRTAGGGWSAPATPLASPANLPKWSPDGRSIAYIASLTDESTDRVMVMPAAGGAPRGLIAPGSAMPPAENLAWSLDARTIYLKAHGPDGQTTFWSVSADGGTPKQLVRFPNPDRQSARVDFAVDARRFYFAIEDRQSDVFVAELNRK